MKPIFILTAALVLASTTAFAAVTAGSLAADLKAKGYTGIEVRQRDSQIKVEGFLNGEKFEEIYDAKTGDLLKRETYAAGSDDSNDDSDDSSDDDHDGNDDDHDDDHGGGDRDGGDHGGGDSDGGDHGGGDSDGGDHD